MSNTEIGAAAPVVTAPVAAAPVDQRCDDL